MTCKRGNWSFIIVAAGSGSRLGGLPKQFRQLGGKEVWKWSAHVAGLLLKRGHISELVLVVPEDRMECVKREYGADMPFIAVEGGHTRSESVINGLKACGGSHVMIHDGARPFLTQELVLKLISKAEKFGSAVPLLPLKDSIETENEDGELLPTDRKDFFRVQTPQAFEKDKLISAMENSGLNASDEASVWVKAGNRLYSVSGEERNFKITDAFDWAVANALVNGAKELRVGHGYDIHRTSKNRKLILAGIEVQDAGFGLLGHSDADVISHALADAVLGAAGEPDIGTLFPANDDKWKDADSLNLLDISLDRVREQGWQVDWADITLIAQQPRLGHLLPKFRESLLQHIREAGRPPNLNIKVKSPEECGSAGRTECIICHATATLSRLNIKQ